MKRIAFIQTQAPMASAAGIEGLDMAMVSATFEQQVSLFFIGDGVHQLRLGQDYAKAHLKDFTRTLGALTFYDIERLYLCRESMQQRGLTPDALIDGIEVLDTEALSSKLAAHDLVVSL